MPEKIFGMPAAAFIFIVLYVGMNLLMILLVIRSKKKKGTYEQWKAQKKEDFRRLDEHKKERKQASGRNGYPYRWIDEDRAPTPEEVNQMVMIEEDIERADAQRQEDHDHFR